MCVLRGDVFCILVQHVLAWQTLCVAQVFLFLIQVWLLDVSAIWMLGVWTASRLFSLWLMSSDFSNSSCNYYCLSAKLTWLNSTQIKMKEKRNFNGFKMKLTRVLQLGVVLLLELLLLLLLLLLQLLLLLLLLLLLRLLLLLLLLLFTSFLQWFKHLLQFHLGFIVLFS